MPIALEKQKQVRKYIDRIIQQKNAQLESAIQGKEKDYVDSAFAQKKQELEQLFFPAIECYNQALSALQGLAEQHNYFPSTEGYYGRTSLREYKKLKPEIDNDEVRELVKKDYRKSIQLQVEAHKEEITRREMEITEKILFDEDTEIAQMVKEFKEMKMEL